MVLWKQYEKEDLNDELLTLVYDYIKAKDPIANKRLQPIKRQLAQAHLWQAMSDGYIGSITIDGLKLVKASVWHRQTHGLIVATRDHKTGHVYYGGRRLKVHYKRYGNFWLTKSEMIRRKVDQAWLDELPPSERDQNGQEKQG